MDVAPDWAIYETEGRPDLSASPAPPDFSEIAHLTVEHCRDLTCLDGIERYANLIRLDLCGCQNLYDLSALQMLPNLEHLVLHDCEMLTSLESLGPQPCLQVLAINGCTRLQDVNGLRMLPFLTSLALRDCVGLEDFSPLEELENLEHLDLSGSRGFSDLRVLEGMLPLQILNVRDCGELEHLDGVHKLPNLKWVLRSDPAGAPGVLTMVLKPLLPKSLLAWLIAVNGVGLILAAYVAQVTSINLEKLAYWNASMVDLWTVSSLALLAVALWWALVVWTESWALPGYSTPTEKPGMEQEPGV